MPHRPPRLTEREATSVAFDVLRNGRAADRALIHKPRELLTRRDRRRIRKLIADRIAAH